MRSIALTILLVSTAAYAQEAPAPAPEPAPSPAPAQVAAAAPTTVTIAGITISGSLDAYASINPARSATNAAPNDLYAFETQANGASVSFAKLAFERKPAPVGFRLDVGFGPTIDLVNATDTAAGKGHDIMRNLEQAYVSWAATPSITLKVGKMVTHHGMEVIESQSNWNYSRSLLFAWAIPFTETGIALDWAVTDELEATFYVVNGLNNTFEGNSFKSPGVQVIYKPTPEWVLTQNFSAFNEQPGDLGGLLRFNQALYLFDMVATYTPFPELKLGANSDIGIDVSLKEKQIYAGLAGYARWHTSSKTALSGRAEYFHDNDSPTLGILLPMSGDIGEATATFSYAPADGLLLRGEARIDHGFGDFKPFTDRSGTAMSAADQLAFILGAVAAF